MAALMKPFFVNRWVVELSWSPLRINWGHTGTGRAVVVAVPHALTDTVTDTEPEEQGDAENDADSEPLSEVEAHTEAHAEGEGERLLVAEVEGDTVEQPLPVMLALRVALCEGQPELVGEGVPERVALAERDSVASPERVSVTDAEGVPDMERVIVSVPEGVVLAQPVRDCVTEFVRVVDTDADSETEVLSQRVAVAQGDTPGLPDTL